MKFLKLLGLCLLLSTGSAAPLVFPTYVPQDTDSFTLLTQRQAAAIAALQASGGSGSSGTSGGLTDTQLRAAPVSVVGTFWQPVQPVSGVFWQSIQPVSVASLPLPAGAATSANQATANTSLASIDSKITAVNTGAVVVASSALPSGAATAANQSSNLTKLDTLHADLTAATPSGANLIGKVGIDQTTPGTTNKVSIGTDGTVNVANITGTVSLPTGAATSANQTTNNSSLATIATNTANAGTPVVSGNVASGTTDAGNPVKVGGVYNPTLPTLTTGQRGDAQMDSRGAIRIVIAEPGGTNSMALRANSGPISNSGAAQHAAAVSFQFAQGSGQWEMARIAVVFKPFTITASSAETTIWTPTSSKKFRVMGYALFSDTATPLAFRDGTAGSVIWRDGVAANSRASVNEAGNGVLSTTANNVLTLQATNTATINGVVFGTEE